MTLPQRLIKFVSPVLLFVLAANSWAEEGRRADKNYASFGIHYNQFKSINLSLIDRGGSVRFQEFPLTADTYGVSLTYGTNISENFTSELRYGRGAISDTISEGALELNLKDWLNWYIGGGYQLTDYARVFAKYGITLYTGDITRYEVRRFRVGELPPFGDTLQVIPSISRSLEEEIFSDHFSTSWQFGVDFRVFKDTFWSFEYGRLLNDQGTGIKVYQLNTLLKYQF